MVNVPEELRAAQLTHARFQSVDAVTGRDWWARWLLPRGMFVDYVARRLHKAFGAPASYARDAPFTFQLGCVGDETVYEIVVDLVRGRVLGIPFRR